MPPGVRTQAKVNLNGYLRPCIFSIGVEFNKQNNQKRQLQYQRNRKVMLCFYYLGICRGPQRQKLIPLCDPSDGPWFSLQEFPSATITEPVVALFLKLPVVGSKLLILSSGFCLPCVSSYFRKPSLFSPSRSLLSPSEENLLIAETGRRNQAPTVWLLSPLL